MTRILLLGGTAEARALAARLHGERPGERPGENPREIEVISSLAGRVPDPALPQGRVRIGGFGGVDGLRDWLREHRVDAVIDATHPFAATITANAARTCLALGLPHLVLVRPAWPPGDAIMVGSDIQAAETVSHHGFSRVFLTTGRSGTRAFLAADAWFLIRAVTPPDPDTLPARHRVLLSRGPYRYDDEVEVMREHRIDAVVTKNSGGEMTRPKLAAAAALGIPVVMVQRPPLPPGVSTVATVEEAAAWVTEMSGTAAG